MFLGRDPLQIDLWLARAKPSEMMVMRSSLWSAAQATWLQRGRRAITLGFAGLRVPSFA
jgi:hypothetical protein